MRRLQPISHLLGVHIRGYNTPILRRERISCRDTSIGLIGKLEDRRLRTLVRSDRNGVCLVDDMRWRFCGHTCLDDLRGRGRFLHRPATFAPLSTMAPCYRSLIPDAAFDERTTTPMVGSEALNHIRQHGTERGRNTEFPGVVGSQFDRTISVGSAVKNVPSLMKLLKDNA